MFHGLNEVREKRGGKEVMKSFGIRQLIPFCNEKQKKKPTILRCVA
jgi:hypothetical protein